MFSVVNKNKFIGLFAFSFFILFLSIIIRGVYYYYDAKEEVLLNAKKEAVLLQTYMMSMREVYHQQFLSSNIDLNESTLGFLPAHASTLISDLFAQRNEYGISIRNVSDKPRNPKNMADLNEMMAINFFKQHPEVKEYFYEVESDKRRYFQFATPIKIQAYCLACHGERNEALPTIRKNYQTAYGYHVGELRGIVSIKIPEEAINRQIWHFIKNELLLSLSTVGLLLSVFIFIYRKILFQVSSIENKALSDSLTGLYNRHYLQTLKKSDLLNFDFIAMLDIDHFKLINDTYGHDIGDKVLKTIAYFIKQRLRDDDIVIRFGGEEFLVLMKNISRENIFKKFDNIRDELSKCEIEFDTCKFYTTICIGIAINTNHEFEETMKKADLALYNAKQNGRNKVVIFDSN